jgi:protein-S-isoprenylcysteine O-methyltransferase Ste14
MSKDSTNSGATHPKPTPLVILVILGLYVVLAWLIILAYESGWAIGWTYVGLLFGCSAIFKSSFLFWNPQLWRRRADVFQNTKAWDWGVLMMLGTGLLAIIIIAVIEFDMPGGQSNPPWRIGLALFVFGWMFFNWCSFANPFFETMVRVQTDEGHHVIDQGPYAIIRHPGYVGLITVFLSTPLLLPSVWVSALSLILALTFVVRTALEDRTLQAELPGYSDYTSRVRYRLIPGVW